MKAQSVLETIGGTPHIRLGRLFPDHEVWIKSERSNPGGSIKDRIGIAMIEAAEAAGTLRPGGTIIEPTSGNTGVGLAMAAAVKGYTLVLVMPESMSIERRRLMQAYGATFDLTPREKGMKGAIARAEELVAATPGAWMPQQFENPANIDVHLRTTVPEILADFPEGVDALITGVGTGGHITACAQALKPKWPGLKVFAVEPSASPVISAAPPPRTRSRASARASCPPTSTPRSSTASSRSRPTTRRSTRAAPPGRKGCSSGCPPAPPSRPSRRSSASCPRGRACSASTTTPASATSPCRTSCRAEAGHPGRGHGASRRLTFPAGRAAIPEGVAGNKGTLWAGRRHPLVTETSMASTNTRLPRRACLALPALALLPRGPRLPREARRRAPRAPGRRR